MLLLLALIINLSGIHYSSSLDLRPVVSGNRMAGVPLGRSLGAGELDVEGVCVRQGVTCQNCSHVVTCVQLPVGWLKIPLHECPTGETCHARLGGCSPRPVPECEPAASKYEHVCEQVGIFPDALDCRKFHLCAPPRDLPAGLPADRSPALCPRHYAYDARTAQCSIKLEYGQCESKPVPDCKAVGEMNVLPSSPNHYYFCLPRNGLLLPQIFLCPNGWFFWDGFCQPEPKPYQPVTSTSTTENTVTTPEVTEKTNSQYNWLSFFSTERSTTYPQDTFLADKFDLSNYEAKDSSAQSFQTFGSYESLDNSFEAGFGSID